MIKKLAKIALVILALGSSLEMLSRGGGGGRGGGGRGGGGGHRGGGAGRGGHAAGRGGRGGHGYAGRGYGHRGYAGRGYGRGYGRGRYGYGYGRGWGYGGWGWGAGVGLGLGYWGAYGWGGYRPYGWYSPWVWSYNDPWWWYANNYGSTWYTRVEVPVYEVDREEWTDQRGSNYWEFYNDTKVQVVVEGPQGKIKLAPEKDAKVPHINSFRFVVTATGKNGQTQKITVNTTKHYMRIVDKDGKIHVERY